jgi:hypothetical protein
LEIKSKFPELHWAVELLQLYNINYAGEQIDWN